MTTTTLFAASVPPRLPDRAVTGLYAGCNREGMRRPLRSPAVDDARVAAAKAASRTANTGTGRGTGLLGSEYLAQLRGNVSSAGFFYSGSTLRKKKPLAVRRVANAAGGPKLPEYRGSGPPAAFG